MELVRKINKWSNSHFTVPMNLLRIFLGIFIFGKGIEFMYGTQELVELINSESSTGWTLILAHYVAMSHIAGGILVFFGLLTRLALLIQLPIFLGALVLHVSQGAESSLILQASGALFLSLVFVVYGSGRYSVDKELRMEM